MARRDSVRKVWIADANRPPIDIDGVLVPPVVEMFVTQEVGAPEIRATFEVRDGRPECTEIRIASTVTGRGIIARDQTVVNVQADAEESFAGLGWTEASPPGSGNAQATYYSAKRAVVEARQRVRRPISDDELGQVATIYRQHLSGSPTTAVAEQMGYTYGTAARRVQLARLKGLLPPTTPGKVNG